ncbi:glycosyltransferase family 2 protein [uncultured Aquimarina sp.]|uniref:glycosyltransferase family 2 protein n=1 Tax=uncultured Aquimarina sp. TaxID=575652 RepID=UPI00260D69AD|nr:glycosyltransferase family 2 protein [uncultured Aquimarina sp.]
MKIAIVILNWNGRSLLEQFLPSVLKYSKEAKVYVADNASTDDSVSYLHTSYPEVTVVQNEVNGGYAKGYNDALTKIDADIYCLLNSDVEVSEGWLTPVINTFKASEKVAAVQPKILDYKKKNYFEYAGAAGGFIDQFGYPYCRGRIFDTLEEDKGQYDDEREIFWASGACLFIRRNVFEEMEGLDEDFFAHQEEIDLCWRIQNSGYQIKYAGQSKVFHLGGATLDVMNPRKTFLNFRNNLLMILKNTSGMYGWFIIFARLLLDGIAALKFVFEGKTSHCLAILNAHFSFYKKLPTFVKKRKKSGAKRKYYTISSVVWQYYILNKKLFNHL